MNYRFLAHLDVVDYSDVDWAGDPLDQRSISGYCMFVDRNLITWRSKKWTVIARSSSKVEYWPMTHTASEMICVQSVLCELSVVCLGITVMHCDNQVVMYIANHLIFYEGKTYWSELSFH